MDIKNTVLNYITKHSLLNNNDSVICAVSGGADSVCMLEILKELKEKFNLTLYVAHVNHQLRGKESDNDEKFVKRLAESSGLPFYCKKADVKGYAIINKLSCEEAGRIIRYDFFEELKETLGADKIATAHNKNDNVETVIMRFARGTDIKGLAGIPAANDRSVIRPILCLNRSEIENYLSCKGLHFVTDSTNLDDDFSRNKTRHNIIPVIESQLNENFVNTMASNIELFGDANAYIEENVNSVYEALVSKEENIYSFCVKSLLNENSYIVKRVIKKTVFELDGINISNELCNLIYNGLSNGSSVTIGKDLNFYVKYQRAFFVKEYVTQNFSYCINSPGIYNIPEISAVFKVEEGEGSVTFRDKNAIYLNRNDVSFNFILRSKKPGDKMSLLNCGTKKIKDIMIDEKIPFFLRDKIPVLEYNSEIIWLCGVRDSGHSRAKNNDKYIKISLHKESKNE